MTIRYAAPAFLAAMACGAALLAGCGKCGAPAEEKVIARINRYTMTVDDFKDEARLVAPNRYVGGDPAKVKEILLDEMITRKLLLEEAQRENFDKDKKFMKEIERYWEQALLKLLIKKKTEEVAEQVTVSDDEIRREYDRISAEEGAQVAPYGAMKLEITADLRNRKIQDALDAWIADVRQRSRIVVYKERLKEISLEAPSKKEREP